MTMLVDCYITEGLLGDYRMLRNPESEGPSCIYSGEQPKYDDSLFVKVPVKKGTRRTK